MGTVCIGIICGDETICIGIICGEVAVPGIIIIGCCAYMLIG